MRVRTEAKRQEILDAASRIFSIREYHEVLTDEIAAEAGVGKGTLYRYFDAKEEIFVGAIIDGLEKLAETLDRTVDKRISPERRLDTIAREFLKYFWRRKQFFAL